MGSKWPLISGECSWALALRRRKGATTLKTYFSVVNTSWYIPVALTPSAFTTPTSTKAMPPATTLYSIDVAPD
jgi:hypothetical protein